MRHLTLLLLVLLAAPTAASDSPPWMQRHAEHDSWLRGSTKEQPRAIIEISDSDVEVVLFIPHTTPDQIVQSVYTYDVYKRTEQVETSFQADGAFFTGTRVLGNFSPTVTANSKQVGTDTLTISWKLMAPEPSMTYIRNHRALVDQAVKAAGLDDTTDEYIEEIGERIDTIASVEGSHEYWKGYYRYRQVVRPKNSAVAGIVNSLGKSPQMAAALKAACYSTGNHQWAGPEGKKGVEFEIRGYDDGTMRPGK